MSGVHAQLSPSSASRWMVCPGSVELCRNLTDTSGAAAAEGSCLHNVSADVLDRILPMDAVIGFDYDKDGYKTVINDEQFNAVKYYVEEVQRQVAICGGDLFVEQRLPIGWLTGEEGAHGTADAVIISERELIVLDAKFGRGVPVDAQDNMQLAIYALAALEQYGIAYDFEVVTMGIIQPRLDSITTWTVPVNELIAIGHVISQAAADTVGSTELVVDPSACRWCKAKATCPAIQGEVMTAFESVVPEVADTDVLGEIMGKADLIEGWVKSIRAEVERRLLAGTPVAGYKLVQGKRGNRKWADEVEAEETLKAMRVKHDQMYNYTVISPVSAEKLAKSGDIGPRQWTKLQESITQAEGKPSVAPQSDKRPQLAVSSDTSDFNDVTGE